ncbi:VOC family protein [bacterium]|nr:VOC family protein [bacterium]
MSKNHLQPMDTIHHVAIQVDNIKESVEWYMQQFSCQIRYQDETWALLEFSNINLALVTKSQHPPHVALIHPHAARFGELKPHRDGTRTAYITDPSGNTVEVMDESSLATYDK